MARPGWIVVLASIALTGALIGALAGRAAAAPACPEQLATLDKWGGPRLPMFAGRAGPTYSCG